MTISSRIETITPKQAQNILDNFNGRNRPIRMSHAERLAKAIADGDFRLTHQGIAFNCDGTLYDGQHRLMAIVLAKRSVQLMVTRGLDADDRAAIDLGVKREISDILGFSDNRVQKIHVAVARVVASRGENHVANKMTVPEVSRFLYKHWDAIDFASHGKQARNFPAVIRGAIARAWYTEDHARLEQFKEVMFTGVMEGPGDIAAVRLRNSLMGRWKTFRSVTYRKAENAISKFVRNEQVGQLYEATKELYPIPGDDEYTAATA